MLDHIECGTGGFCFRRVWLGGFLDAFAEITKAHAVCADMGKVRAVCVADGKLAEDIIEDRSRILDRVVTLHQSCRLKAGEGEGFNELVQRHAVLQRQGNGDGEVVHHRAEGCALFVHIDKDFAQATVFVFARPQIDLVATDHGLLRVALAAMRQLFAFALCDLLDDHFFNNALGDRFGTHGRRTIRANCFL